MENEVDVSLSEATLEQIALEIHSRSRDFLVVAQTEDGSHGEVSHFYYGHMYASLGLAVFATNFLQRRLIETAEDENES